MGPLTTVEPLAVTILSYGSTLLPSGILTAANTSVKPGVCRCIVRVAIYRWALCCCPVTVFRF